MLRKRLLNRRSGSALLEYVFLGIPSLFLTISVFEASLGMWQYHTMAEAVQIAGRYVSTHGATCNCGVTTSNIATVLENAAVGLSPVALNLTLTSNNATLTCTISDCISGTNVTCSGTACPAATFPPSGDNAVGKAFTIGVKYQIVNPIAMYWPGAASQSTGLLTLGAQSEQEIVY